MLSRWIYAFEEGGEGRDVVENIVKGAPSFLVSHTRSRLRAQTEAQGLGRHSKEDVMKLGERDVRSLSTFLGKLFPLSYVFFCHQERMINNSKVKILVVVREFNLVWNFLGHTTCWLGNHSISVKFNPGYFQGNLTGMSRGHNIHTVYHTLLITPILQAPYRGRLNINMSSYKCRDPNVKDKTVTQQSFI